MVFPLFQILGDMHNLNPLMNPGWPNMQILGLFAFKVALLGFKVALFSQCSVLSSVLLLSDCRTGSVLSLLSFGAPIRNKIPSPPDTP